MLILSPEMELYGNSLMDGLNRAIALAKEARSRGLDPSLDVEIPIASDLADRVEALLGIKGVAVRIRELSLRCPVRRRRSGSVTILLHGCSGKKTTMRSLIIPFVLQWLF